MTLKPLIDRPPPRDLPVLTSLRFVAATMIVVRHLHEIRPELVPAGPFELTHGVSFFFVLSGFILTHSCMMGAETGWRDFMIKRLSRIVPCHLLGFALALCLPNAMMFVSSVTAAEQWPVFVLKLFLLDSLATNLDYAFSLNGPSWSLSVELFFSVVFLLLLRAVRTAPWATLMLSLVASGIIVEGLRVAGVAETPLQDHELNVVAITYLNPFVRMPEFVLGMALYTAWRRYIVPRSAGILFWSVVEIAATTLVIGWFSGAYQAIGALVPNTLRSGFLIAGSAPVAGLFILLMATGRGILGRLLAIGPFVWLGRISFAIYITHYIVLKLLAAYGGAGSSLAETVAVIIVVGSAAHALIEVPMQRLIVAGTLRRNLARRLQPQPLAQGLP